MNQESKISKGLEEVGSVIKKCKGGYGFIRRDLHPKKSHNAYFHVSNTIDFGKLQIGERVRFRLSQVSKKERKKSGQKNPAALQVCRII